MANLLSAWRVPPAQRLVSIDSIVYKSGCLSRRAVRSRTKRKGHQEMKTAYIARLDYKGWPNCCRLTNGLVDLIVTTDVGPRIIRFGFVDDCNELKEYEKMLGKTGGTEWRIYGGHRLWHAPEREPRTYVPDNSPIQLEQRSGFARLIQPVEPTTGIQKEIDIRLAPDAPHVDLIHRLRNLNAWAVEFAPWALTVLPPGGQAIVPLPPRGRHSENLSPVNSLTMWAYTDMTDPRWTWGRKYIMLRQDSNANTSQKFGAMVTAGWAAYARDGHLFVKHFHHAFGATYPDLGCSLEVFTNNDMLELGTLGPLSTVQPNGMIEHIERWFLFRDVPTPRNEEAVDEVILPQVRTAIVS
jgi:hypothetical protein